MAHFFIGPLVKVGEYEGNALAEEDHMYLFMSFFLSIYIIVSRFHRALHGGGNEEARDSVEIESSIAFNTVHINVIFFHNGCVDHERTKTYRGSRICSLL